MERIHWDALIAALASAPNWRALHDAVLAVIIAYARAVPRRVASLYAPMQAAIRAHTGAWYGSGRHRAGDETVRGFCWCHSPWQGWSEVPAAEACERATQRIVDEVRACHAWYVAIARWIEASAAPGDDPDAFEFLVAGVVDLVVDLGIHDSWYGNVTPIVAWALERHGAVVPEELAEAIEALCELNFTSWSEPASARRHDFAEAVALALLDRALATRWPDVPGDGSDMS
jgi:hypothetical protein